MEIPNRRVSAERGKQRQRTPPTTLIRQVKKEPNELKRKMLLVGYLSDELSKRGLSYSRRRAGSRDLHRGSVHDRGH